MNNNLSEQRKRYLKNIRTNKILINVTRVLILLIFLGAWELFARLEIIDSFLMSMPSKIVSTIVSLYKTGELGIHLYTTLYETVLGFLIATALGTLVALVLWWSDFLRQVLEPYIVVLNSLPKIALGPLIIIWFGTGEKAIVTMTVMIGLIVAILNMLGGFMATDENKLLLLRSMGANKLQILLKLVVPSSLPAFISMLKINVGMAWIGSIMGEYIVSRAGIGYLIVYGGQVFKLDLVMASVLVLCVLAAGMYAIIAFFERLVVKNSK